MTKKCPRCGIANEGTCKMCYELWSIEGAAALESLRMMFRRPMTIPRHPPHQSPGPPDPPQYPFGHQADSGWGDI